MRKFRDVTVCIAGGNDIGFYTDRSMLDIKNDVTNPENWKFGEVPEIESYIEDFSDNHITYVYKPDADTVIEKYINGVRYM